MDNQIYTYIYTYIQKIQHILNISTYNPIGDDLLLNLYTFLCVYIGKIRSVSVDR